jgi:hypothetical protein
MMMMNPENFSWSRHFRCWLWVLLIGVLAGCIVEPAPGPVVATPNVEVGVEGGLVYYPDYEVYYDPATAVFWYPQGGVWVRGPRPPGIDVNVVLASPHVRMDFRDSPANHHAEIVRRYPHGWRPERR